MRVCPRCSRAYDDHFARCPNDGAELRTAVDPLVGRVIGGRYRLIARIGAGGMSSVYMARHVALDRRVAIKVLRRDLAQDAIQRDRFLREARAVNRINHANIVEISDCGQAEDGLIYLVMEFVDGVSLLKAFEQGPFSARRALHIAEQAARALARAHQMGIVHRDLKPENILLTERDGDPEFVKVLDFGIAKIFDAPSLTGSQQIFGTPGYIAPEYIQSTDIDGRADLYSLGVILYEMVTGALPFDYEYPGDLLVKHVTEEPVAPTIRHASVPRELEAFILRSLRKTPDARFRDAHHFLEELGRVRAALRWRLDDRPPPRAAPEPPSASPPVARSPAGLATVRVGRFGGDPSIGALPLSSAGDWRKRFDHVHGRLRAPGTTLPPEAEQTIAFCVRTLQEIESVLASCEQDQRRIEALEDEARDVRATLGRAMDDLAGRLSQARGEHERAVADRDGLRARREAHRSPASGASPREPQQGQADALLWQLASAEQAVRRAAAVCDDRQLHIAQLGGQLDRENERIEQERARLVQRVDREMARVESMTHKLRARVQQLEAIAQPTPASQRKSPPEPFTPG